MTRPENANGVQGVVLIAAAALTFGLQPASASAQPAEVSVTVDATAAGTPLEAIWPYYGFDEPNYTTTPAGRELLATVAAANSDRVFIRNHFLLNTGDGRPALKWGSTNVYNEDALGRPVYDWRILDSILDGIAAVGARPFAQIGFMPRDLSTRPDPYRNSETYALDGGCFYPPRDYAKWAALVRAWAEHARDRYPDAESTWQWELWNEPDIGYFHGTPAEYARLYDHTEAALHAVLPKAPLGGPETAGVEGFLSDFLNHCAAGTNAVTGKVGTRLDIVTFHAKGGTAFVDGHVRMDLGNQLRIQRAGFRATAAVPQFRRTPIIVGEADPDGCAACPAASRPANAYRNVPAYGAYVAAMMKHSLDLAEREGVRLRALLTWAWTFDSQPLFLGYRELATGGIHKPVLNVFKMLGRLRGTRLPAQSSGALGLDAILARGVRGPAPDVDALAVRDGKRVLVLLWNYHDDLVAVTPARIRLSVRLPVDFGPRARLTHYRVDDTHSNAYAAWLAAGSPANPDERQRARLRAAMQLAMLEAPRLVAAASGSVTVATDLPRFGVSLVVLEPGGREVSE
jgi:xylan 1,4-beta-xylosidase